MRAPEDFRILIVDDEESIRNILAEHFELDDFQVFTAESGNKALALLDTQEIDFILSDIRMPDGDGESLLRGVRERNPNIPMIVLVSGFSELSKEEALALGAFDVLGKPFDVNIIEKMIKDYMAGLPPIQL